jgi:hypothetical protein
MGERACNKDAEAALGVFIDRKKVMARARGEQQIRRSGVRIIR